MSTFVVEAYMKLNVPSIQLPNGTKCGGADPKMPVHINGEDADPVKLRYLRSTRRGWTRPHEADQLRRISADTDADSTLRCTFAGISSKISRSLRGSDRANASGDAP